MLKTQEYVKEKMYNMEGKELSIDILNGNGSKWWTTMVIQITRSPVIIYAIFVLSFHNHWPINSNHDQNINDKYLTWGT